MPPSPLAKSRKRLSHGASEREEMDSRLEHLWSFYLSSLFELSWVEVWVLSLSLSLASVFLFILRRWPILHEDWVIGRKHFLDRPFEMDRLTVEIFGFVVRGIVWRRWISILGVGNWYARHFEASKTMGTQRRQIGRWQVPSSNGLTIWQSSK